MNNSGFTLIEVMLSIAMIAVITGFSAPVYMSFLARNDLDVAATTVVQTERRAEVLARSSESETAWGVVVGQGTITLFQGIEYSSRDASLDETFDLPNSITASGDTEIIFQVFTGMPQGPRTVTLTSSNGDARTIYTNEKGTITY